MTCEKVQAELPAYLSGDLEPSVARQVAEHVAQCRVCAEEMKTLERLGARIAAGLKEWVEEGPAPPDLEQDLRQAIRQSSSRPVDVSAVLPAAPGRGEPHRRQVEWWRTAATAAAAVVVALALIGSLPQGAGLEGLPLIGGLVQLLQGAEAGLPAERTVTRDGVTLQIHRVQFRPDQTEVVYSLTGAGGLSQFETAQLGGTLLAGGAALELQQVQVDVPTERVTAVFAPAPTDVPVWFRLGPLSGLSGGPWEVEVGVRH